MGTYRQGVIGHGYNEAMLRVEHRPEHRPHTPDELLRMLDEYTEAGVDAWWYSVSAKGSYPLFPSRVLPYKQDAATDLYPWLVEAAHARGMVMVSWEYLNTAPLLMEQHPDWRVRYLEGPVLYEPTARHDHFACILSPYGDLLKEYCVEVFSDLGFDVIWFDGCYQYACGIDGFRWTCCCERCAEAFGRATGMEIPQRVNWQNNVFRAYLDWRYRLFEDYWHDLSTYVRERCPESLVVFNFFNRHYMGATSGNPLHRRRMPALIAAEGWSPSVVMQTKTLRAVNDTYAPEVWTSLLDGTHPGYPSRPNPDPAGSLYFAGAAATAGGYASFGLGGPHAYNSTLRALADGLRPLRGLVGGQEACRCGVVLSGYTKDFGHAGNPNDRSGASRHQPAVDAVYGMGYLLDALHHPYAIILDNMLTQDVISDYDTIILPDVRCMDDSAARVLAEYVENGGTLVATGETGTRDRFGRMRAQGLLDDIFGIIARNETSDYCILEPVADRLQGRGLPPQYMIGGQARLVTVRGDTRVLALARTCAFAGKVTPQGHTLACPAGRPGATPAVGAAVCERASGKGKAIYIAPNISLDYAVNPSRRGRELVNRLLENLPRDFITDAPTNVLISLWRQPNRLVVHILNQPATMITRKTGEFVAYPEDSTPTGPIRIRVHGVRSEHVDSPNASISSRITGNATEIILESVLQHAVLTIRT